MVFLFIVLDQHMLDALRGMQHRRHGHGACNLLAIASFRQPLYANVFSFFGDAEKDIAG
jgi:hypothetical protein